jgi:hypothetical protein
VLGSLILFGGDRGAGQEAQQDGEDQRNDEISDGGCEGKPGKACSACHSNRGDEPYGGRGGEAVDLFVVDEDETGADEADPGDDLCGDARRIEDNAVVCEDVGKAVLGDEQEERRSCADDGVSAESGAFVADFAFETDDCGKQKGNAKLKELAETLSRWFGDDHGNIVGSGFDETVAALPLVLEAGPDGFDFGAGDGFVAVFDEGFGFGLG